MDIWKKYPELGNIFSALRPLGLTSVCPPGLGDPSEREISGVESDTQAAGNGSQPGRGGGRMVGRPAAPVDPGPGPGRRWGLTVLFGLAVLFLRGDRAMPTSPMIDLRSDTVTKPTDAVRRAMAEAEVGDDVMGEDPTVRQLEERVAELLGKPAALFVPSGTMANQIAIGLHAKPGDELVCDSVAHVYLWEGGGISRLWGVTPRTVEPASGLMGLDDLRGKIRPDDMHYAQTRLVCMENTHNRRGGRVHPITAVAEVAGWAQAHHLKMHLDGARLMNAVVASGIDAHEWARYFDSVSVCFSKGLGAPVGSALVGSSDFIDEARRLRKVLGGGCGRPG